MLPGGNEKYGVDLAGKGLSETSRINEPLILSLLQ